MATLKQIRRRIRTVESTRHITKAMEMVAASKLRQAQASVQAARPYAAAMEAVLTRLAGAARSLSHPLFEEREVNRILLVVVASDKGLCGGFNASVFRRAEDRITELGRERLVLLPVGKRACRAFVRWAPERGLAVECLGDLAELQSAHDLARRVTDLFLAGEVDRVEFVYTHFITTAKREVEVETLVPVAPGSEKVWGAPYIFEPDAEAVLASLLPRYVATRIFSIFADSLASEHSARMLAMGNATRNADDMITSLTLMANRLRQSVITRELLELVGGAEALA